MSNIGYYHSVLNGRIEIKLWSGRFLSFFSFLIKLLYIIHQKTPRTVKKKTEAPQVDVEGLSLPSYFRYSFCAYVRKEPVDLKPKEILLLKLLLDHANQVLTRDQILDYLWKEEAPMDRVVDVYIKNLRRKLQLDCIVTIKGIGYKFEERL